jgi:hypothetical protein
MSLVTPALPDVEALLSKFLRDQDEIDDAIAKRVYTVLPERPTFPLVLLTRVAGVPVVGRPLVVDRPRIQIDSYGGGRAAALANLELVRRLIAERLVGKHDGGVVAGYTFGNLSWLPDNTVTPSRPRFVADVELTVRPLTSFEQPGS